MQIRVELLEGYARKVYFFLVLGLVLVKRKVDVGSEALLQLLLAGQEKSLQDLLERFVLLFGHRLLNPLNAVGQEDEFPVFVIVIDLANFKGHASVELIGDLLPKSQKDHLLVAGQPE